jgi:hypothetical protein
MIPALASTLVGQLSSLTGATASASTSASTLLDTAQKTTQAKIHHGHGGGFRNLSDQLQSALLQQQSDQTTPETGILQSDDLSQTTANLG